MLIYMFSFILSILAALFVANLFTTFPLLAAYFCGKKDKKDRTFIALAIIALNAYFVYSIIISA